MNFENILLEDMINLYQEAGKNAEAVIEDYLIHRLGELSIEDRIDQLEGLIASLRDRREGSPSPVVVDSTSRLLSSEQELLELLAEKDNCVTLVKVLKNVSDIIDELFQVTNALAPEKKPVSFLELLQNALVPGNDKELLTQLNDIKFAIAGLYEGSCRTTRMEIVKLLEEIAPEKIAASAQVGLRIGSFKKSQLFDIYSEKHEMLYSFINKPRFSELLTRSFERAAQKAYFEKRGEYVET